MARYQTMYEIEVSHPRLSKYRHIRGTDRYVVQQKAAALAAQWDAEWERRSAVQTARDARESLRLAKDSAREEALELTHDAQMALQEVQTLLAHTLKVDDRVAWEELKDRSSFPEKKPAKPTPEARPDAPLRSAAKYQVRWSWLWLFSRKTKDAAFARAASLLTADEAEHAATLAQLDASDRQKVSEFQGTVAAWEEKREAFLETQRAQHRVIDERQAAVAGGDAGAIVDLIDLVLGRSSYPSFMSPDFVIDYVAESRAVVVDYELPSPDRMPTLKEVKFVQTSGEFTEKHIAEAEKSRLYDAALYQIALRTVHEIFEADEHEHIQRVTLNGWVSFVDRATGADGRACILSLVNRADFLAIDLGRVDPKECFKALKGVAASKLYALAAVAPLQRPRETDTRFIESRDVAGALDEGVNVASMDWKDFEHLVRQIFEVQFATPGSEVKVTQASRDGGVDAIVFDPDPIRGGKIVIQAKRYINTVDVSAVRDLYGTVMNEGATKGILVTTSQYGPDAYKFAQGKPLTLLDGGNLLHLLEQIGVQARIDVREARELQKQA